MANRRNDMLGVGGQRKKLSRTDQAAAVTAGSNSRRTAAEQKQELLRKMRERAEGAQGGRSEQGTQDGQESADGSQS
jgi:hypothetical protein